MNCFPMSLKPPGMLSERNRKIPVVETSLGIWKIFIKQNSHKILRLTSFAQDASGVYVFVEMPSVVVKYKIHYIFDILYFKILLFYCLRPWRAALRDFRLSLQSPLQTTQQRTPCKRPLHGATRVGIASQCPFWI